MSLRKRHGKSGRYSTAPVIEVKAARDQQPGIAAPASGESEPHVPRVGGKVHGSEGGRALALLSAKSRREKKTIERQFVSKLRIAPALPTFEIGQHAAPFVAEAERFLQAKISELASNVGGGVVGAGVVSILRTVAWQTYLSRMLFELATGRFLFTSEGEGAARRVTGVNTGLLAQASRLGEQARTGLLAAHELCRLEALARIDAAPVGDAAAAMRARLLGDEA